MILSKTRITKALIRPPPPHPPPPPRQVFLHCGLFYIHFLPLFTESVKFLSESFTVIFRKWTSFFCGLWKKDCHVSSTKWKTLEGCHIHLLKLSEISHSYKLDQFIYIVRVVGWHFSFFSNFDNIFWRQTICCISSGSSLFAKVLVMGFPEYKALSLYLYVVTFVVCW